MAKGLMGNTHGHSSPDRKMGRYQDLDKGTWRERYQRSMGWWREAGTSAKQVTKHRAAKKRRDRDKKESKKLDD
jgi:hypothetical protein